MTGQFEVKDESVPGKITITKKSPHEVLELLMNLLMKPSVKIKDNSKQMVVEMIAPGFQVGKSTLEIQCSYTKRTRYHRGTSQWADAKTITPIRTENIYDKNNIATGFRYYYPYPTTTGTFHAVAKGLYITAEQIHIPKKELIAHDYQLSKNDPEYRSSVNPRAVRVNTRTKTTLDKMWAHSKWVLFTTQ